MMDQLHVEQQCDQGEDASYAADRQGLPWNDFDHKAAKAEKNGRKQHIKCANCRIVDAWIKLNHKVTPL